MTITQTLAVWALPVLFAVTLHEVAHGWVARALGDPTAARLGRLSLNPMNHVDPVGTLLLPGLMLVARAFGMGGFLFGWAKPVPVDWHNFKNPRRDMAIVAAAGPLANLAMAIAWAVIFKFAAGTGVDEGVWYGIRKMGEAGIVINLSLMVLNLLPLPPLDGGRVLLGVLPAKAAYRVSQIEPYGMVILILLLATGILGVLLSAPYLLVLNFVRHIVGI